MSHRSGDTFLQGARTGGDATRPTFRNSTGAAIKIDDQKPKPLKSAPVSCAEYTRRAGAGLRVGWAGKSAGLPILNLAFHLLDHDARLDFGDHDQRKGSEEI